jgi:hypothetical protein
MRFRAKVIVAALVMIPAVLTQTPARADWCAQYSSLGGTEKCGFLTKRERHRCEFLQAQSIQSGLRVCRARK